METARMVYIDVMAENSCRNKQLYKQPTQQLPLKSHHPSMFRLHFTTLPSPRLKNSLGFLFCPDVPPSTVEVLLGVERCAIPCSPAQWRWTHGPPRWPTVEPGSLAGTTWPLMMMMVMMMMMMMMMMTAWILNLGGWNVFEDSGGGGANWSHRRFFLWFFFWFLLGPGFICTQSDVKCLWCYFARNIKSYNPPCNDHIYHISYIIQPRHFLTSMDFSGFSPFGPGGGDVSDSFPGGGDPFFSPLLGATQEVISLGAALLDHRFPMARCEFLGGWVFGGSV